MSDPASSKKSRHAILAMRSHGPARLRIAAAVLTPSIKRPARFHVFEVDGATDHMARKDAKLIGRRLRQAALYHYNQPEIIEVLNRALAMNDAPALPDPAVDLSHAAEISLGRRGLDDVAIDLAALAARQGLSRRQAERAARNSESAVALLCDLFAPVFLPALANPAPAAGSLPAPPGESPPLSPEDISLLAEAAPPAPDLPKTAPHSSRRRGPWGPAEILDCALRMRRGASLDELALLTGRSPRAIRAQLLAEGLLRRCPQAI